jgi:hypothetical protein
MGQFQKTHRESAFKKKAKGLLTHKKSPGEDLKDVHTPVRPTRDLMQLIRGDSSAEVLETIPDSKKQSALKKRSNSLAPGVALALDGTRHTS